MQLFQPGTDHNWPGVYEVTFTVSSKPFDKAAILTKRNITISNPEEFTENSWFVNSVLVVGELLN